MRNERLSRNFKRGEFACRCGCGFDTVDFRLIEGLQRLRDIVGEPIVVNSGCRCAAHNAEMGGSPKSQHLLGKAADIVIRNYRPAMVANMAATLAEFADGGIGIYATFTHVDVRHGRSRWTL